jgi:hypothetical protein
MRSTVGRGREDPTLGYRLISPELGMQGGVFAEKLFEMALEGAIRPH